MNMSQVALAPGARAELCPMKSCRKEMPALAGRPRHGAESVCTEGHMTMFCGVCNRFIAAASFVRTDARGHPEGHPRRHQGVRIPGDGASVSSGGAGGGADSSSESTGSGGSGAGRAPQRKRTRAPAAVAAPPAASTVGEGEAGIAAPAVKRARLAAVAAPRPAPDAYMTALAPADAFLAWDAYALDAAAMSPMGAAADGFLSVEALASFDDLPDVASLLDPAWSCFADASLLAAGADLVCGLFELAGGQEAAHAGML